MQAVATKWGQNEENLKKMDYKMGPKWRNHETNAGRYRKMKWRKLQKTENQVFSTDNFLIWHVELFVFRTISSVRQLIDEFGF